MGLVDPRRPRKWTRLPVRSALTRNSGMDVQRRDELKHTDRQKVTDSDTDAPEDGARGEGPVNGIGGDPDEDSSNNRDSDSEWSVGPSEDGIPDPVSWTPEPALIPDLIDRLVRDGVLPLVTEALPRRPPTPEAPPPEQSHPEEAEPQPEFSPPGRMEISAFDFNEERQPETRPHALLPRRVAGTTKSTVSNIGLHYNRTQDYFTNWWITSNPITLVYWFMDHLLQVCVKHVVDQASTGCYLTSQGRDGGSRRRKRKRKQQIRFLTIYTGSL
uniref:Uncharacterized protein n=1 Tax=Eptatretus burgeri TaxID=7764 RepID=A0A8C4WZY4_EPTBU